MTRFQPEPFRPPRWLANPHLQTLLAARLRRKDGVSFRRERLTTPDGDFLDVDFADVEGRSWAQLGESTPIVLLLHGLEGSARRPYAHEAYRQLARCGIRALGMNFRACSGEINRLPRTYHAGETGDPAFVLDWLESRFPDTLIGILAFSLGANMLLKYLGERSHSLSNQIKVAVAISPPFDLSSSERAMQSLYTRYLMGNLKRKAQSKARLIREVVDLEKIAVAKTLRDFDHLYTAPLHGFQSAEDYYRQSSCGQFLAGIAVPSLILRAQDDPFFDANDIPYATLASNPCLHNGITRHGGHVGFIEGRGRFWAERQAAHFLQDALYSG